MNLRQRLQDARDLKKEPRELENLCAEVLRLVEQFEAIGPFDGVTIADLRRMIPVGLYDPGGTVTYNPVSQVYFRAGLLACREYMARFIEQGGDHTTAASVRANWWPSLGPDPGKPRQLTFDEVAIERENGRIDHADTPPSIEALARAYTFLAQPVEPQGPSHA